MQTEEFLIISNDGLELFGRSWVPAEVRGVICLVHGLGEHIGRYHHVADHFTRLGFALYAYDQRGHGQTKGKRGHARQEPLWNDVENVMRKARVEHLYVPMFVYGHSWGGNVVANFLLKRSVREITGAVLTSPWFELSFEPPGWQIQLGRVMAKVYGKFTQSNQLDVAHLSRDLQVGQDYSNDPLVHDKISAALFLGTVDSGQYALENAHKLKVPTLVVHGTDDQITSAKASEKFVQSSDLAHLKLWPDYRHETHNEMGKETVLHYISDWIEQQMP